MRIAILNCNTTESMTVAMTRVAGQIARPGTEVIPVTPAWGVASAEGFYDSFVAAAAGLHALDAIADTIDGVVLAGFGEHGREGARQRLACPVVDITEAAAMFACLLGLRFGVVTTAHTAVDPIRHSLVNLGLYERCSGIRATGIPVLDLAQDQVRTLDVVAEASRQLLAEGADVIVLGCAGLAGSRSLLSRRIGAPVVDGVSAALTMCEDLVHHRFTTSKVGAYAWSSGRRTSVRWPAGVGVSTGGGR
jgi:allantoin racemase